MEWQSKETAPCDNSFVWASDGEIVWFVKAYADGTLRSQQASKVLFWMPAIVPDPPIIK